MKLTGDLSVSSIYRSHFISTCNIKWETDLNTGEMTACHLEQPAELPPLSCTAYLYPQSEEEGSWGESMRAGLRSEEGKVPSGKQTVHIYIYLSLSPKCQGYTETLQSEIDFCLKQQRTMKNILHERI